jgi:hypothetical protein
VKVSQSQQLTNKAEKVAEFLSEFLDSLVNDEGMDADVANQIVIASAPTVMAFAMRGIFE